MKTVLVFTVLFGLFYFEPIRIGPITFAILWKGLLLTVLALALLSRRNNRIHRLSAWGLLFAIAGLPNESLLINPIETVSGVVKNAYIPILFGFWLQRVKKSDQGEQLNLNLLLGLSAFIVFSTIPFLLNIIPPISSGYDLSIFGEDMQTFGFVGIFQNSHGASITIAVAAATLFWSLPYVRKNSSRILYMMLLAAGLTATVLTLVRSGLIIFGSAILMLLATSRKRFYFRLAIVLFFGTITAGFYLFQTSETFRLRMLGLNVMMVEQEVTLNQIGSGRFLYWVTALERFFSSQVLEQLFGFGPTLAKDYMYEAIGRRIYAHNGFIDILQFYGYFGIFAYTMMLVQFFRILFALPRSDPYFGLLSIHLTAYLVGMMVQGERYFMTDVLLVLSLVSATFAARHNRVKGNVKQTDDVNDRWRMAWRGAATDVSSSRCGPDRPDAEWPSLARKRSATRLT